MTHPLYMVLLVFRKGGVTINFMMILACFGIAIFTVLLIDDMKRLESPNAVVRMFNGIYPLKQRIEELRYLIAMILVLEHPCQFVVGAFHNSIS